MLKRVAHFPFRTPFPQLVANVVTRRQARAVWLN